MLKNKNFALGTAALLLSTAGFTACSSDDTFTGSSLSGEAVKTQFAINIPVAKSSVNGRLSQEVVQGQSTPTFRGMSKIKLIPFSGIPAEGSALPSSGAIVLKDISNSELTTGTKFYDNTAVPVGTSHFLFYGEATPSGDQSAKTNGAIVAPTEFENGDLAHIAGGTLAGLNFNLQGIHTQDNNIEGYLSAVLTKIATSLAENAGDNADLKLAAANMKKFKVGSSAAILAEVQNIYNMVKVGGTSENTTIAGVITNYFNADGQGKLTYKTSGVTDPVYVTNADNYPNCYGIPANAAAVSSSDGKAFAYVHSDATDFSTYVYPASLYYFVNSAAKTDDEPQTWAGTSVKDWAAYVGGYAGTAVTASTQAIALENSIRYAVAQLVYNVKFGADEMPDAQSINREVGENFELTGITIGSQKGVDYKFEQKSGEAAKTIYDPVTPKAITTTPSTNFYTLALQSAGSTSGTESVNFALEFVNNGDAFYGQDGLVPTGGTFYLAGTLNADNGTANGYVFKQAYKTTANITINSLKTATYTIPDLRQTELTLGLSVNLTWEAGLTQDVDIN